ncbi:uncharacterized protein LOC130990755 [Salvia miltiorrhiza]|uniref:uncharacterized protein LOC130990755 n=1 Tax=Salvia miltiorrhiza TaxID=226208 RepID=UPI0025AC9139|nr:uncharacterized protein LOC130990755 [Salvia miltiorrhiza]
MAPYEALYGKKCRLPLYWDKVGERRILGPDTVGEMINIVRQIRQRIKEAQDRQKSYANKCRTDLQFECGDKVFLKVSPSKGIISFGVKVEEICSRHVIQRDGVILSPDMSYEERPESIIDRKVQVQRNKSIPLVKVL